jgi:glycosyltransferase involved in cell wall biosynthesis
MALLVNNFLELPLLGRLKAYTHKLMSVLSCRKADKVFYPTYYAMKLLGDLASVPVQKRRVVNHGTDYEYWSKKKNAISVLDEYGIIRDNYVLFVSNFYIYKRAPVLIDAFALLISNISNKHLKLVLVGTMPNETIRENIFCQMRKLGLQNNVVFLENIPLYNLAVLYQEASVFVCPSVMETFGQIYVEAMASGAPVVCADTEFANELCGDAASYFKVDDIVGLADALTKVLGDKKFRAVMRDKSYSRAKLFSWEREARETLSLLKEVTVNN